MQGRRIDDPGNGIYGTEPGDYWQLPDGTWRGRNPDNNFSNLAGHDVVEHDDGTITVTPSILTTGGEDGKVWHGFLRGGEWVKA
jgi:hypothetical protein